MNLKGKNFLKMLDFTPEEIEGMIIAIKNNKSMGNDIDGFYAALTEFKSGNKNCEHPVEYEAVDF